MSRSPEARLEIPVATERRPGRRVALDGLNNMTAHIC